MHVAFSEAVPTATTGASGAHHDHHRAPCRHQFVLRMLTGPTTCAYCTNTIWVWQGLRYRHCRLCKINFHNQCFQEVLRNLNVAPAPRGGDDDPHLHHNKYNKNIDISTVTDESGARIQTKDDSGSSDNDDPEGAASVVVVSTASRLASNNTSGSTTQSPRQHQAVPDNRDDDDAAASEDDEGEADAEQQTLQSAVAPLVDASAPTAGRFFMVHHRDVPSIPTTVSYFVHHHELAPTRFILPKWECLHCGDLLAVGEEGLHCLSCDGCNLHMGCKDAFLASEAGAGARCLTAKDVSLRSHDENKSAIVSETMSLMHLFRRRNVKWSSLLTMSNPFTLIPTIIAQHTALYEDSCQGLAAARCNNRNHPSHHRRHDDAATAASSSSGGDFPPAVVVDEALIHQFQDALRYATAVYGLAYQRDAMTSCLGGVVMHVFRQQTLLTPKDEVNNIAVTEILALPRESLKFARWSYKTLEPSYCVLVDHAVESIVLAFRGSLSDADFLSDACGFVREFCDGHAHQGMADMVDALFDEESHTTGLIACLSELLERHVGYRLLVTGHSLGGGLAQLFGVRLAHDRPTWLGDCRCWSDTARPPPAPPSSSAPSHSSSSSSSRVLSVVAFAPPPVFTLPCADRYDDFVSCIVGGNDVVCRMQLNSIDRLANDFGGGGGASGKATSPPASSSTSKPKQKASAELYQELTEELHLTGQVYLLTHPTSKRRNRMLSVPRSHFLLHHIFVMPDAFSNHLMDHYGKGLRSAAAAATGHHDDVGNDARPPPLGAAHHE